MRWYPFRPKIYLPNRSEYRFYFMESLVAGCTSSSQLVRHIYPD